MLALVLAMMVALHPSALSTGSAREYAATIADVAAKDPPPDGMSRELGAAFLVVYAWGEGRFSTPRRGDGGKSVCSFQIMVTDPELRRKDISHERRAELESKVEARKRVLERDIYACTRAGYAALRASQHLCGDMRGFCGNCWAKDTAPAAIIARDRARAAQGILDAAMMEITPP